MAFYLEEELGKSSAVSPAIVKHTAKASPCVTKALPRRRIAAFTVT
jgi:hypothetical protein